MIPYGRQDVTQDDIDAVVEVLRSPFLTQGPAIPRFEQAVAAEVGARFSVAVNSATAALHLACMALELKQGDVLWTVPNTFVASANCGRYCGAAVDFVDIDKNTWNMCASSLRNKLVRAKQQGQSLPKIVVPVHFGGQPTDQEEIWELSAEFGFKVIEDASHAIGASAGSERVGSCRWSHVTVFSFHPVKIITTGEGGMALTNDPVLAERMSLLRSHGITREADKFVHTSPGSWYYEQHELGFNFRMTDIQAALGLSQLKRLRSYVDRRNSLATRYDRLLKDFPLQLPTIRPRIRSAFHLYVVRLNESKTQVSQRSLFDELRAAGVGVNLHYYPVHLQPYYRRLGFGSGYCPEAERYSSEAITLPLFPAMTEQEQDSVVAALARALRCES